MEFVVVRLNARSLGESELCIGLKGMLPRDRRLKDD